jgi:parallel beta-helix repeat protein
LSAALLVGSACTAMSPPDEPASEGDRVETTAAPASVPGTSSTLAGPSGEAVLVEPVGADAEPPTQRPQLVPADLEPVGPIRVRGTEPVVIDGKWVTDPDGRCIDIFGAPEITITNSIIGPCGATAIQIEGSSKVTISDNRVVDSPNGINVLTSRQVDVRHNEFVNAGRNFVFFDKVTGPGNRISDNVGFNRLGESEAEDFINLYKSSGTAESPIIVSGNHLENGGPSTSGSGIMTADAGGAHQLIENNTLVNPGQVGIGVASGTDITVRGNRVVGEQLDWSNIGIYVWEQYGLPCSDIRVENNLVRWSNAEGQSNGWWNGGGCGEVAGIEQNNFRSLLTIESIAR